MDDLTLLPRSLDTIDELEYPVDAFTNTMSMLDTALEKVGAQTPESLPLPDYFDGAIMRLIDAIPLE